MTKREAIAASESYARVFGTTVYAWCGNPVGGDDNDWRVGSVRPVWACDFHTARPPGFDHTKPVDA